MWYSIILRNLFSLIFRDLSVGRGSTATVGGGALPIINSVEAWDGKDGEVSGSGHRVDEMRRSSYHNTVLAERGNLSFSF